MQLSIQFPNTCPNPPTTGWGFVTEAGTNDAPLGPKLLAISLQPSLQIPYTTLGWLKISTKAPPLGQESGLKDALIPTIARKGEGGGGGGGGGGGNCIDRCIRNHNSANSKWQAPDCAPLLCCVYTCSYLRL